MSCCCNKLYTITRLWEETDAGESYFYNFVTNDIGNTSAASLLRGFAKFEPMTIAELNQLTSLLSLSPVNLFTLGSDRIKPEKVYMVLHLFLQVFREASERFIIVDVLGLQ
ncbi:hypothetical protein BRARA_H00920 [Brassica rapa]|uniref:Uncharacterized protein n=1 Tax=Brassica campestris TaxID=3711 RepID=A0A397Y9N5_BRACM|nr:hypothetical protein BRARA_H00920 [Brassica rapa]